MGEIVVLPLLFELGDMRFYVYPVVLKEEEELTLVDCGYPGFLSQIEEAFKKADLDITKLTRILLTHHDHDHMGALKELTDKYPGIKVYASEKQCPYITGKKQSLRLEQAKERLKGMAGEQREGQLGFIQALESVRPVDEVAVLSDGEELPICKGVIAIDTSGHMPGHLSFYIKEDKTLISGDALCVEDSNLVIADEYFVLDKEMELESLKKLINFDIDKVICYHGGVYESDAVKERLNQIIEKGYC